MTNIIIETIAVLLSPIIALWISENAIRKRNQRDRAKKALIEKLIANRHQVESDDFLKSFNSVLLYWNSNDKVKKLIFDFRYSDDKDNAKIITELIYTLCKLEGFDNLSREDISNVAIKV